MKILLIILSVINVLFLLIEGISTSIAGSSFGYDIDLVSTLIFTILAVSAFCIILPWLIHVRGKRLAPLKATGYKWMSFVLAVIPLLILIVRFLFG